jgi:cytochrome c556
MLGAPGRTSLATCLGLLFLAVLMSACSSSKPTPAPPPASALWGELKPVVSVKELMHDMIDPLADNIFDAVGTEMSARGTIEREPRTDEDWEKIRIGAVSIAEGASLLKIPRPFAPPGDQNNSTGPDAPELSPAQIKAKLEADPAEWNARIEALRNVGLQVLDIVKRKDVKELWDASDNLDEACENCHKSYWYPGENAQFYQKLNRRLRDFEEQSSGSGRTAKPLK